MDNVGTMSGQFQWIVSIRNDLKKYETVKY